jgi:hypothetical protein
LIIIFLGLFCSNLPSHATLKKCDSPFYLEIKNSIASEDQSTYQQVGTFTYNGQNGRVILLAIPFDGPGPSTHLRLVEWQGNMVVLTKYSDTAYSVTGELTENFSDPSSAASFWDPAALSRLSVSSLAIPLLDFADSLVVKNTITLTKKTGLNPFFGPTLEVNTNDTVLITDAVHGPLYTSTSTGAFYFVTPDGFPVIYSLKPDFVGENDNIPQVTWKNGEKNTETYAYTTRGGCGSIDFISVVLVAFFRVADHHKLSDFQIGGQNVLFVGEH